MSEYQMIDEQIDMLSTGNAELGHAYSLFWENTVRLKPDQRFKLLEKLAAYNDTLPIASVWNSFTKAQCFVFSSEYLKSIETGTETFELFKQMDEKGGLMSVSLVLYLAYKSIGRLDKAQDYLQIAIDIVPTLKPNGFYEYARSIVYYQASELQILLKKYDQAIEYLREGIKIGNRNPEIEGRMHTGMGNAYMSTDQWQRAKDYFHVALDLIRDTNSFMLESKIYADLGNYYLKSGDLEKALENQERSLKIRLENNLLNPAIVNYIQLADLYDRKGNTEAAIKSGELAILQAEKTKVVIRMYEAHQVLSKIYDRIGDTQKAYTHYKKYQQYREEVFNQEMVSKIEQVNAQHKVEIMTHEKEIFRLRNVELKQLLEEITESVKYAKRIQKAILPSEKFFRKYFPDSFILYKPKDIVSGDFYWMDVIDDVPFLATCDCTGHGVPGALVSVVCHNALNRAMREFKRINPGETLDKTRELIIEHFSKSDEEVKDGMDCILSKIDLANMQLTYAAANNSFYIIRSGELLEQSADKMPVGKYMETLHPFSQRTVSLQRGDVIFTFSDGYADQFGGPKEKKFGYKQFEKLLLSIASLPLPEQQEILTTTIQEWKGKSEQTDDILVVGIKI